jgi:hypothetical protein
MKTKTAIQKHFVIFFSPGIFFSEQSSKPIASWDVDKAVKMSQAIIERYNSRPYGFQFATRARTADDLDSKEIKRSGTYFLGGRVMTLTDVKREMPEASILISNMKNNGYDKVVVSRSPWQSIHPLEKGDTVIPMPEAPKAPSVSELNGNQ